jgi:hypothetical protein
LSIWSRIRNWGKAEPVPFVPVYPVLCAGEKIVASPLEHSPECRRVRTEHQPARRRPHTTKPWNKPKALRNISAGVLADMRSAGCYGAFTVTEINEWIDEHVQANALNIGGLAHTSIRAAIKKCSGVRCENRRLLVDPAYEALRSRHRARKQFLPERCWIFIIEPEPESTAAELQPNERRAA